MKSLLLAAAIAISSGTAMAHSPLELTVPSNEAKMTAEPETIDMTFKKGIRLTKVSMTHANHPAVSLELAGAKGFITEYSLPMQKMGPGIYLIEWRGLGQDGHTVNGDFTFSVEDSVEK